MLEVLGPSRAHSLTHVAPSLTPLRFTRSSGYAVLTRFARRVYVRRGTATNERKDIHGPPSPPSAALPKYDAAPLGLTIPLFVSPRPAPYARVECGTRRRNPRPKTCSPQNAPRPHINILTHHTPHTQHTLLSSLNLCPRPPQHPHPKPTWPWCRWQLRGPW